MSRALTTAVLQHCQRYKVVCRNATFEDLIAALRDIPNIRILQILTLDTQGDRFIIGNKNFDFPLHDFVRHNSYTMLPSLEALLAKHLPDFTELHTLECTGRTEFTDFGCYHQAPSSLRVLIMDEWNLTSHLQPQFLQSLTEVRVKRLELPQRGLLLPSSLSLGSKLTVLQQVHYTPRHLWTFLKHWRSVYVPETCAIFLSPDPDNWSLFDLRRGHKLFREILSEFMDTQIR